MPKIEKALNDKNDLDAVISKSQSLLPNAAMLWKYSSNFMNKADKEPNSTFYKSINDIKSPYMKKYVYSIVKDKLNKSESRGIVFGPNSDISKTIANSLDLKSFISKNNSKLLNKQVINKATIEFQLKNSPDLYLGIHYADVIMPHIDKNGNFHAIIGDIYDFALDKEHPEKTNIIVKKAFNVQENKMLENYFDIFFIDIDKNTLKKYLTNN